MNLLFQTRKPRPFHHEMVYADDRRERLAAIERRARHELGLKMDDGVESLKDSGDVDAHSAPRAQRDFSDGRISFRSDLQRRAPSRRGLQANGSLMIAAVVALCALIMLLIF